MADRSASLRDEAGALFAAACRAADPRLALRQALQGNPLPCPDPGGRLLVVAVGKAAIPMAETALDLAGPQVASAIVVTNRENARPVKGARVHAAGHPVPDEGGGAAVLALEALLHGASAADRVVALISGGGSALLPAPVEGVTLQDKAEVSRILLASGFDIGRINLVRQALSRLKGGGLLRAAAPAPVSAYILSDVIGDDLRVIASGLTVAPVGPRSEARHLLRQAGIWPQLPRSVQMALSRPDQDGVLPPAANVLIGSNRKSLDAVVAAAGPGAVIAHDALTGDVVQAAGRIIAAARGPGQARCLVFGGETTVTLCGTGLGGRNQELALRVALSMPDLGRDWVFLSGGTDGRDGPTDAAGGVVDAGTAGRLRAAGVEAQALLDNNDSHRALSLSGDLLITGATGTNVADVQILLLGPGVPKSGG